MKRIKLLMELIFEFFKLGIFTIGGGMVMVPLIEDIAVNKKKWITKEEMVECIALSQALPGVIAIDLATYVGKKRDGFLGSILATIAVVLPSFVIMFFLAHIMVKISSYSTVQGVMIGLKSAVTGLIGLVLYKYAKNVCKNWFDILIAILSVGVILLFKINAIFVIIGAGLVGILVSVVKK